MAILFMDGFNADAIDLRWTIGGNVPATLTNWGRLGGEGARCGDQVNSSATRTVTISGGATKIAVAFAVYIDDAATIDSFMRNMFGSNTVMLWETGDEIGIYNVPDDASDYSSSTGPLTKLAWHWVEAEVFYSNTVGTIKCWVDGVQVIDASGLNTPTIPATVSVQIGGQLSSDAAEVWYDDLIVYDDTGSYNNTAPLGDTQVLALFPDGEGNVNALVGSDGNSVDNYLLVDEFDPDTATYVGSSAEGDKDLYTLEDLPSTVGDVLAISVERYSAKTDTGAKFMRSVIRTASTDYPQSSIALSTTYEYQSEVLEEDPNTTAAWTGTNINGLQAGPEVRNS
jgi:hypothetical protein